MVLTPELLNYLRNEFLRGEVPWVAEVDLLLSALCSPAGYESYTMAPAVRAYLLREMRQDSDLGLARMEEVARLLINYVRHLARTHTRMDKRTLQAQQWAAMVYLDVEATVQEIAEAFQNCVVPVVDAHVGQALVNREEMARLSRLTQDLAPGLEEHSDLVEYAANVTRLLVDQTGDEAQKLYQSGKLHQVPSVAGVDLPALNTIVPQRARRDYELADARLGPIRERWALLVGINRYVDPAFPPLRFCVNDVLALERMLKRLGYTVIALHDDADAENLLPTMNNIEAELLQVCQSAGSDDLIWVHFACHGMLADGQAVLVTYEARLPTLTKRALRLTWIKEQMQTCQARRLVLTLDTTHPGVTIGR
jgi:hypothetical protein